MLHFLYDVIIWGVSGTSSMLKSFMKFLGTCFKFWLSHFGLQHIWGFLNAGIYPITITINPFMTEAVII